MNKKAIDHEQLWEHWYQLRGSHPRVDHDTAQNLYRMGFFAGVDLCYDFVTFPEAMYLSDREMCDLHPINGWLSKLIDDKRFIPLLFRNRPHLVPELSVGIEDGEVKYCIENGISCSSSVAITKLMKQYCRKYQRLFVKPAGLSGGRGAFLVDEGNVESAVGDIQPEHAYLVNNCLRNEEYSERINPHGVNTIRVHFFRGNEGIRIYSVIHKFGTSQSGLFDNLCTGGVVCEIDVETGQLSRGFSLTQDFVRLDHHPESRFELTGFSLPNWPRKLELIAEILDNLSFLDFGGCDIAVTNNGLKLLEVNSLPGRTLMQFNRPALLNEEFRSFLLRKGYRMRK